MNQIQPEKWSPEWYQLATSDELSACLQEAKQSLEHLSSMKSSSSHFLWQSRLHKLEQELSERKTSEEEWGE